ncbi:hepcidin-like isoform X2 [Plectropomus leopardus]|uniref:hepcidin-like isoform X2 n=2 Tax=Plectropomus leopardus TaxID=160734 RepID=UPI001C4D804D|nr:hepcidin-like isoform X2 [Plectropomus leopardus]
MKTFSVAVAVAVMLAFICTQESSALPLTGVEELEQPVNNDNGDNPVADHQEWPMEMGNRQFNIREKRSPVKCTPYCYPTGDGVFCGVRCDFCC